jgi:hypothetical protein
MINWLPAPKGDCSLYDRPHWPEDAIFKGSWIPPAVTEVK